MNILQKRAYDVALSGKSVFITGSAGVGKSYCVSKIMGHLRYSDQKYGVTATTGAAAILIGGTTLHSYLGIGLARKSPEALAQEIRSQKKFIHNRILKLLILIIDEVSMLSAELFDKISRLLQILRECDEPFGGIQLILSGDILQLPPVEGQLFIKSQAWEQLECETIELLDPQRQNDKEFVRMLQELRRGVCTADTLKALKATKANVFPGSIKPTLLYAKNIDVDSINHEEYDKLSEQGAKSCVYIRTTNCEPWAQICKVPEEIKLCVGCQVVLTWNVDVENGLCNGSRGVVTDVLPHGVEVQFHSSKVIIQHIKVYQEENDRNYIKYMPLKLAFSLTINKCQGMTLDYAIVVLDKWSNAFGYGRAYTALSRVRSLDRIIIEKVSQGSFIAHPDALEFYDKI